MDFRREENNLRKKKRMTETCNSKEGKKGEKRKPTHMQIGQTESTN